MERFVIRAGKPPRWPERFPVDGHASFFLQLAANCGGRRFIRIDGATGERPWVAVVTVAAVVAELDHQDFFKVIVKHCYERGERPIKFPVDTSGLVIDVGSRLNVTAGQVREFGMVVAHDRKGHRGFGQAQRRIQGTERGFLPRAASDFK